MGPGNYVGMAPVKALYGLTISIAHMMRLASDIVRLGRKKLGAAAIIMTSGSPALLQTTAVGKPKFCNIYSIQRLTSVVLMSKKRISLQGYSYLQEILQKLNLSLRIPKWQQVTKSVLPF